MAGVFDRVDTFFTKWAEANNPMYAGPFADALSLIPFLILMALLYLIKKEKWLAARVHGERVN
jgi:hypothetical protein